MICILIIALGKYKIFDQHRSPDGKNADQINVILTVVDRKL